MTNAVKSLKESKSACWIAWACLVVPMFASYFFDDMFSTISHIFQNPDILELGWNSQDYGFYAGGYSFLCVWGGLIVCGMLLDKWGVRVTGSIFVGLMAAGAALVYVTISSPAIVGSGNSLTIAYVGYKVDGVESDRVPYDTYANIEPIYKEFKGWKKDLTAVKDEKELPVEFMEYIKFIEAELNVPIKIISLGPDREQTIIR